ncbi:hypothetical protein AAZX31_04G114400 [Glycine max]
MIKNENQVFLVLGAKPNPPKLKLNFFISLVETLSPLPFVSSIPFLFLVTLQPECFISQTTIMEFHHQVLSSWSSRWV